MLALAVLQAAYDEEVLEGRNNLMLRKQILRDTSDPFHIGDEQFRKHYRMYPYLAIELIEILRPQLPEHPSGIPSYMQVLTTLRFLSEGSYQKSIGQDCNHPMSQSTFSKYLHRVIPALNEIAEQYIQFPTTREERQVISERFQERLGFPGVVGAIDCTLCRIHTPAMHEEAFVDHNQNHSLNVQVVADVDYNILDMRITNGSTHDVFVWRYSDIRMFMYYLRNNVEITEEEGKYFLIGDSGYLPSPVLLTPVLNDVEGSAEDLFSHTLRRSRCRVEQLFGIWKEVMRCINNDRSLHYEPNFAAEIILASGVLYNFLRHHGMPMPVPPHIAEQQPIPLHVDINDNYQLGLQERNRIIEEYFAH